MKIKENFVLRNVADTWVVLPLGESAADFNGMLALNETGVVLWKALAAGCDKLALVKALTDEYDVSDELATSDVEVFLDKLAAAGCLDE